MAKRTHADRDKWEDRFFDQQTDQLGRIEDKLEETHDTAKKGLEQALLTNDRVTHVEAEVKENLAKTNKLADRALARTIKVEYRLGDLEADIKPITKDPKELKAEVKSTPFWQDTFIRRVIIVVGGIIILAAIGFNNDDIKGFFGG